MLKLRETVCMGTFCVGAWPPLSVRVGSFFFFFPLRSLLTHWTDDDVREESQYGGRHTTANCNIFRLTFTRNSTRTTVSELVFIFSTLYRFLFLYTPSIQSNIILHLILVLAHRLLLVYKRSFSALFLTVILTNTHQPAPPLLLPFVYQYLFSWLFFYDVL